MRPTTTTTYTTISFDDFDLEVAYTKAGNPKYVRLHQHDHDCCLGDSVFIAGGDDYRRTNKTLHELCELLLSIAGPKP
jgi:hypothetical protein